MASWWGFIGFVRRPKSVLILTAVSFLASFVAIVYSILLVPTENKFIVFGPDYREKARFDDGYGVVQIWCSTKAFSQVVEEVKGIRAKSVFLQPLLIALGAGGVWESKVVMVGENLPDNKWYQWFTLHSIYGRTKFEVMDLTWESAKSLGPRSCGGYLTSVVVKYDFDGLRDMSVTLFQLLLLSPVLIFVACGWWGIFYALNVVITRLGKLVARE